MKFKKNSIGVDYMDAKAMKTMLKMEVDVFSITNKEPSDPSAFVMPIMGNLIIGFGLGFLKIWKGKCVMKSQ